ncbi:uncharacterized protein LOC126673760 [Mercurialis annua]|uniref:uncharacterized protein LOC126673760 n=1 Tax=Mercurialis annua TaxID=3986 RepID=UPI002160E26E|nr:uncharacterized protein LOC126673760 [Mercurialis annua]XP_050223973.1 uncharacterized protein LOC126673760 [Mercurialis annua]
MAYTLKLLNQTVKLPLSSVDYLYCSSSICKTRLVNGKYELTRTLIKQLKPTMAMHCPFSKLLHSESIRNILKLSGRTLSFRRLLGVSFVIGSVGSYNQVAYAMEGQDILVDDRDYSVGLTNVEKYCPLIWIFVKKLWLPAFFLLTVLTNWNHPIMLLTKALLFLFTTKPSPLSVYVFVEQLCQRSMREKPYLCLIKSLYANKVEVEDFKLFCLATVEVKDQKVTLIGVLGGWWTLPLSWRHMSVFWDGALH